MYLHIFNPYTLGLSKVVKLKTILLYFIQADSSRRSILQGFTFITHIFVKAIKGQGPLEGEGVEVVVSKYIPGTYFSL